MATTSFLSNSALLPNLTLLRPINTRKLRFSLAKLNQLNSKPHFTLRTRIRASKTEDIVVEVRESDEIELNGNGSYKYTSSVEEKYTNGSVGVMASENGVGDNGSMVKYVNSNGNGVAAGNIEAEGDKKNKKKKTVEEIGQEDAWFKQSQGRVEV